MNKLAILSTVAFLGSFGSGFAQNNVGQEPAKTPEVKKEEPRSEHFKPLTWEEKVKRDREAVTRDEQKLKADQAEETKHPAPAVKK